MRLAADAHRAAEILRQGGVVAFPTETVYGLGADASNAAAVRRVFQIKGRPPTNPVIVHVADIASARRCVSVWPEAAQKLAERFWPGPLTIVLPKAEEIVAEVTAGGNTVGVRVPDHPLALEMLREFARLKGQGGPASPADAPAGVAAPSANRSSRVSPTTAQHVRADLGEPGGSPDAPDMLLDGGPCTVGIESTVLSLAMPVPTVLRPGAVSAEELRDVLGEVRVRGGADTGPAASPGRQERHYAPRARVVAFTTAQRGAVPKPGKMMAVLAISSHDLPEPKQHANLVAMPGSPAKYAQHFYRILRRMDALGVREIWIELPPETPQWLPVRDRIQRASARPSHE